MRRAQIAMRTGDQLQPAHQAVHPYEPVPDRSGGRGWPSCNPEDRPAIAVYAVPSGRNRASQRSSRASDSGRPVRLFTADTPSAYRFPDPPEG
jgi:hypothetical protein